MDVAGAQIGWHITHPSNQYEICASSQHQSRCDLATALDQVDDWEAKPMSMSEIRGLTQAWRDRHNDGEDPAPEEGTTRYQLSALAFRLESGGDASCRLRRVAPLWGRT